MTISDLCTFLLIYSLVAAMTAVLAVLRDFRWSRLGTAVVAIGSVTAASLLGGLAHRDVNLVEFLITSLRGRDQRQLLSVALGIAAGLAWAAGSLASRRASQGPPRPRSRPGAWAEQAMLSASVAGVVLLGGTFAWNELYRFDRSARVFEPGYVIESVADFERDPIRVVMGNGGEVFVSLDQAGSGFDTGLVMRLTPDPKSGKMRKTIAARSPMLYRPYGLAYRDGALYVSRSGHRARAVEGRVFYEPAGAVTQLKDLDGDGYFEYCNDVVTGLPGSGGPDAQHQNNGIAFDRDGRLFVTNGVGSNRAPGVLPWEGTILRVPPDFGQPEVFARGFRNPFGIAIGPKGEVFATDNDVDADPGDELNHVVQGGHYGHPYAIPGEKSAVKGAIDPIYIGPVAANLTGLAYSETSALPETLRGCFFATDTNGSKLLRLRPVPSAGTFKISEAETFADVANPVDVCVSEDGMFYVVARFAKKLYRIRPASRPGPIATRGAVDR